MWISLAAFRESVVPGGAEALASRQLREAERAVWIGMEGLGDSPAGFLDRWQPVGERLGHRHVDLELSLGDFVLSGGEIAAMALIDACVRQLPGALNDDASAVEESFVAGLLDCPHYTRPEVYEGMAVPDVLLSGHHENIRRWRLKTSLARTRERRPELFAEWLAQRARSLSKEEAQLLREIEAGSSQ